MRDFKNYAIKPQDWREALRRNQNRTFFVVFLFFIIYSVVGFGIDLYLNYLPQSTLEGTAKSLAVLKIFPMATLVMFVIALISLLITYFFHENIVMLGTEYHEVTERSTALEERQLYNVVEELKIAASLKYMPKIYIIDATYMNAFASGLSEKSAMIAITKGLLEKLDRDELQAVVAHELSHIRHNDIRLTLMVTVLSNLMIIAIDIIFRGVLYGRSRREDNGLIFLILVIRFVLPILTLLLMLYLSRTRELMADAGSVELTRTNLPLARALLKIDEDSKKNYEDYEKTYANTANEDVRREAYLYDPKYAGLSSFLSLNTLFSTHPPLEQRLKALGFDKKKDL